MKAAENLTNNIPNTTAKLDVVSMWEGTVTVTAEAGYKILTATITYTDSYGSPIVDAKMTISPNGDKAVFSSSDMDTEYGITINGTTEAAGGANVEVTNEITLTTETHSYNEGILTITVTSNQLPAYRFIDPKANYTTTGGQTTSVPLQVEVLEYNSVARATISDLDPSKPVTITGRFEEVNKVTKKLTNCKDEPPLQEWYAVNTSVPVTLVASEGNEFNQDTPPRVTRFGEFGSPETWYTLAVTPDRKKATGTIVFPSSIVDGVTIVGEAVAAAPVGKEYGAINVYLVTLEQLNNFAAKRFFEAVTQPGGETQHVEIDLGDYVNRIKRIYTAIPSGGAATIYCGNYNTGVACEQPAADSVTLDFGGVILPASNGDSVDYENTYQLFLPFHGFVNLDNSLAGQEIGLTYRVNLITGEGAAIITHGGNVIQVEEVTPSNDVIYRTGAQQRTSVGGDSWDELVYYGTEPYVLGTCYESVDKEGLYSDRAKGVVSSFRGRVRFTDIQGLNGECITSHELEEIYYKLGAGVVIG